jgi:hypothetical protein
VTFLVINALVFLFLAVIWRVNDAVNTVFKCVFVALAVLNFAAAFDAYRGPREVPVQIEYRSERSK